MRKHRHLPLVAIFCLLVSGFGVTDAQEAQESADLIFLIDGSDKTGSAHFAAIRDFLVNFLERLPIGARQIQVGVVQYSNGPRTAFSLNSYSTKADVLDAVKALRVIGGEETNVGAALDFVVENHFTQAGGSRVEEGVPQVLVLISGSQSTDDIRDGVVALKQASIFSFGLGAQGADRAELQHIATDENFVFTTPEFRSLGDLREYLLPYIVGVAQRTIVLQPPTIVTQVIEVNKRDIVFLIDGTSTRGSANFNAIRDFLYKVVQKLEIGQDLIQVAVAQYADTVKLGFHFKDFQSRRDVLSAIRRLRPINGTVLYTGAALDYVRNNFFNGSVGYRASEGVPKLLVLITGGKSLDDISYPAQELKRSGIMAFAIGSPMADRTELEEVAFDPSLVFEPAEFRPGPMQAILPGFLSPLRTLSGTTQVPVNKRDIIFLLDGSLNVGNANFPYVRDFVMNLVNSLDVGYDNIRVGLVQFSDTPETEFSLDTYQSKSDLLARLRQLQLKGGSTLNIGSALDFVRSNHFTEAGGSRIHENIPQLLLLLAAGQSGDSYLQASNALARAGVLTFCVGASQANKAELEQIAFNPSLVYLMDDFSSLPALPQQLIQPLTTYVSGGVEEVPLAPTEGQRDILFLFDGSANLIGQFPAVRDFLYKIIDELNVKPDGTRIAVAQYSDNVKVESRFSDHQSKTDLLNHVKRMKIKGGKLLNVGQALDFAQRNLFVKSSGSRIEEGVPQFLVLLAAGRSTDRVDGPAQNLRQVGIIPFIFQAKNADPAELERIVPSPAFILAAESLPKIGELQPQIVNLLKTVQNGGPSPGPGERKDIVFLIDGSDRVRSDFPFLKDFVRKVVESLDVGPDRVRVAVVQFSERARPAFYLNSYSDQRAVLQAVRQLSPLGGASLHTGSALDFVLRNVLVESAGSRMAEGVPQVLIVLSAGRSQDDIQGPAVLLKRSGAVPFGIGIGHSDDAEMRTISYVPDFAAVIPTFQQLAHVQQLVSEKVILLSQEELQKIRPALPLPPPGAGSKRDVVFLIDGSQNTVQEFSYIRALIESLIEELDVGFDTTRVAVIQFSEDPRVEFLLNAHSSKDDVQAAVRRLRPKGGRQINVGSALDYVSKNIFRRPLGSRLEEGVPQFLVLISSGRSSDDVEDAAAHIKETGVAPFTVARNVDPEELVRISLSPEYVFSVSTFRELPSLEQKLLTPITTLTSEQIKSILSQTPHPRPDVEGNAADIVFLVDSSDSVRPEGIVHIRDFIRNIVRKFDVGPNRIRIGLAQFSNEVFPEFYLRTHKSQSDVLEAIRRLRFRGGSPLNTGKALEFVAKNFFVKSAGSRIEDGVPQHLVLFLGGKSQDDVSRAARVMSSSGIIRVGVGSRNVDRTELETITGRDSRLIFTIREFRDLHNIKSQVLSSFGPSGVTPTPPGPFSPPTLVPKKADIVFLLDGSINFKRDNFQEVLRFVSGIVDTIYEGGDSIQVGLVQYNSDPTDEFFLKDFSTKEEILDAINKVVYKGGRQANTLVGLEHLRKNHFVPEAGSRIDQRIPQIAFVITGGSSVEDVEEATRALSQKGVKVFAVGVRNVDLREVSRIASNSAIAFRVSNVQELSELSEQVLETLHDAMHETLCPGVPDVSRACHLDVILGFDGSPDQNVFVSQRGLEAKVDAVLSRVTQLQRISCTGSQEPTVRVAAVAYTPSGPVEGFDFSAFQPDLFEKFQTMRNQHPYMLTADTLKAYQSKFRSSPAGSVKVVIHFTDGVDGDLAALHRASAELQEEGVKALIFVGLERAANYDNVMQLEFGRGFTYNRPLAVSLMDLDYELAEQLDSIAERACCGVPCKCSGQRGDRGPLGSIGPKGMPGEDGYRGYPGDEGGPGERGPPGVNGTQGFQGCPGQRGTKGSRGFPGEKGELGEIGLDGLNGEEGDKGLPGSSGDRGSAGRRGDRGAKGEKGERGDMGIRGDPGEIGRDSQQRGPKGEKGEIGPMGVPGRDGRSGGPGGVGKDGGPGRRGPPGGKGNKGGPGQPGISGESGARGPQGPPGPTGPPGLIGEQGIPGPRGGGGTPGVPGDRGRPGPLGAKGEPGDPGPKGGNGPRGPRGEMGDDGRDGMGLVGQKGKKGERGFPGYPGPKGAPGDRGGDGGPGPKGSRGRRGNSGPPGGVGQKGDPGYPGPSGHKGIRGESVDQCSLIQSIKDKCPCCYGPLECPVFPTELAFALDTSQGVSQDSFSRMRDVLLKIVGDLTIAESNCPRGARVAVVTYNNEVTTEIRFPDSKRKALLLDRIRNLQVPLTSKERSLETAMAFVARNTFKRARSGFLMRKVAVFFSNGLVRASPRLNEAVLKLSDAGITPLFLTSREDRTLINALQINNTAVGHALVLPSGRNLNDFLKNVLTCHVCLDICNPDQSCGFGSYRPAFRDRRAAGSDVDIDMAFILDSSETTTPFAFNEMRKYIAYTVKQLDISPDPKMSQHLTRVAVLQHAPWEHEGNSSFPPVRVELSLTDYGSKDKLVDFLSNHMTLLPGTRALGNAIEYTIESIFESAPNPRDLKIVVLMVTGEVKKAELDDLQRIIVQAKCKGYFFVVLGIGRNVNVKDVYSFASEPNDVFFKLADKPTELNEEPLLRFARLLPSYVNSENAFYLSPDIRKQCDWFQGDQPAKNPIKLGQRQIHVPNNATSVSTPKPVTTTKPTTSATLPSVKQNPVKVHPVNPAAAHPPVKQVSAQPGPVKQAPAHSAPVKQAPAHSVPVKQTPAHPAPVKQDPANPISANSVPVKQVPENPVAAHPFPVKQAPADPAPAKPAPANPAPVARPVASKLAAAKPVATKPVTPKPLATKPQATKPLSSKPAVKTSREVHVSEITENSARLRWVNPDQPNPYIYDLTITSTHDRSVVLRQNLTVAERVIGGLVAGQTYHVAVVSYLKSQVKATYEGMFTTRKTQPPPPQPPRSASSATVNLMVNSEPWKGKEADICKMPQEIGTCGNFALRWFYDPESQSCGRFWYSGCGDNGNNFATEADCEKACMHAHISPGVISTIGT